jgi:hypothetical protein
VCERHHGPARRIAAAGGATNWRPSLGVLSRPAALCTAALVASECPAFWPWVRTPWGGRVRAGNTPRGSRSPSTDRHQVSVDRVVGSISAAAEMPPAAPFPTRLDADHRGRCGPSFRFPRECGESKASKSEKGCACRGHSNRSGPRIAESCTSYGHGESPRGRPSLPVLRNPFHTQLALLAPAPPAFGVREALGPHPWGRQGEGGKYPPRQP